MNNLKNNVKKLHTVLVTDDNKATRELIAELLAPVGYKVMEAETGNQTLSILDQQEIDVAIDVIQPVAIAST